MAPPPFDIRHELSKLKIPMPLSSIFKNPAHKREVSEFLGMREQSQAQPAKAQPVQNRNAGQPPNMMVLCDEMPLQADLINLQDDAPKIVIGNLPKGNDQLTPPFYITLELQNLHLHNCLYD